MKKKTTRKARKKSYSQAINPAKKKSVDWAKVLKASQRMEQEELLQRFYWLMRDLEDVMVQMSPRLKGARLKK